jgi:hypothetical protein
MLSAAIRHEEVFSRRDALHLFSDELLAKHQALKWLRERKVKGGTDGLLEELLGWSRESALNRLREWAGAPPPAGEVLGHVRRLRAVAAGELNDEDRTRSVVTALAAAYVDDPTNLWFLYFDFRP